MMSETSNENLAKKAKSSTLESIRYKRGHLEILDQLKLPLETQYDQATTVEDGWQAIRLMKVRGAPAIAVAGTLSVAVEMQPMTFKDTDELVNFVQEKFEYLTTARPTAVNMTEAAIKFTSLAKDLARAGKLSTLAIKDRIIEEAEKYLADDVTTNQSIGLHGANHLMALSGSARQVVMTHCNTGSLATAGYGTALGVIRALHEKGVLDHVYCTETRPYNQGARLTSYELVHDAIPSSLITDSMAAFCMLKKGVTSVVVGADRVVANGDTANKIGTYQLALAAKHHGIPFFIAAPVTTCDLNLASGDEIVIEERPDREMMSIKDIRIAAPGIGCWNPAFDVTPAELITGIITEHGVFTPDQLRDKLTQISSAWS